MNWEAIGAIAETLGALGVIASLGYLAAQIRINTKTLRANARSEGQLSLAFFNETLSTNPEVAELIERLVRENSVESFSETEMFQVSVLIRAMIQRFEAQYFQYEAGIIEERVWQHRRRWLKSFLDTKGISEWWNTEMTSSILTPDFISNIMEESDGFEIKSDGQAVAGSGNNDA